jgi:hypothetical protein
MEGFDVNNSIDFIQKVKDIVLQDDKILMSFDVVSLFSSIPIDLALQYMHEWFITRRIDAHKISCYEKQCMEERELLQVLQPNMYGKLPVSLHCYNVFMRTFETNLKSSS